MRATSLRPAGLALLVLALAAGTAQAGLFDDEEARKAIIDLRERVTASEDQSKARIAEMSAANAQLAEQLGLLRRSLLELNGQIEAMRGEIARLRGSDEQVLRELAEMQRRQKDATQAIDDRLGKLEPMRVTVDGREFGVDRQEKVAYDEAMAAVRGGEFDKAVGLFNAFQRRYPSSGYGDSVRFWLGNALYGKRDLAGAIAAFRSFVTASPDHPRAPEALLAMANSQAETKDTRAARRTLEELLKTYPQSEAAQAGKQRLAAIKP